MKEWTDEEVVSKMLEDAEMHVINGEKQPMVSMKKIEEIFFDPRFPESKKAMALDFMNFYKNEVLPEIKKQTDVQKRNF